MLSLLQRGPEGYRDLVRLIAACHERSATKGQLRREAAHLFRTLLKAGVVELRREGPAGRRGPTSRPFISTDLQRDFSLHHSLSLFLLHALHRVTEEDGLFRVLSLVEAILEDPTGVLMRQREVLRSEAYGQMKADRVDYDERQEKLEQITWPMPGR